MARRQAEEHAMSEPDDPWRGAYGQMLENEDVKPLAALLATTVPIPNWLRVELAGLLNGQGGYGTPGEDRLEFVRTDAMRGKIATQKTRFRIGMAVLDAMAAGKSYTDAVKAVMKNERRDQTEGRSVKQAVAEIKRLPPVLRPGARKP
jgi:hypothetical protein